MRVSRGKDASPCFLGGSIGFAIGVVFGLPLSLWLFCREATRDELGVVLAAATLVAAVAIAALQIALALTARSESGESLQDIQRNLYPPLSNRFCDVFQRVRDVLADAATADTASVHIGWPVHNLGNINAHTRGSGDQRDVQGFLLKLVKDGMSVDLATTPLVLPDGTSPFLRLLEVASQVRLEDFDVDVVSGLVEELRFLAELLAAVEEGQGYRSSGQSPLTLRWVDKGPVHWSYWVHDGSFQQGILFTSAAAQDEAHLRTPGEAASFHARSCEGMQIQAAAAPVLTRLAEAVREHQPFDVLSAVEPRLLRMLVRRAMDQLSAQNSPRDVLRELAKDLHSADRLAYWRFRYEGAELRRAAYVWQKADSRDVIVVVPSAAGIYALWREDEKSLRDVRFPRYARFCKFLRDSCGCNVVLLSEGGQGGYGLWSPRRSEAELEGALAELPSILGTREASGGPQQTTGSVVVFGICTGGLAALSAFVGQMSHRTKPGTPLNGIALWDVAADPGFNSRNVRRVKKRYDLLLADTSEFGAGQVTLADSRAEECCACLADEEVKRVWIGGVNQSIPFTAESTRQTRSWDSICQVANQLRSKTEVAGFGDLGHVPGGPNQTEFDKFLISVGTWAKKVLVAGVPAARDNTERPAGGDSPAHL